MTTARLTTRGIPVATPRIGALGRPAPTRFPLRFHRLGAGLSRTLELFLAAVEAANIAESAPPRRAGELSRAALERTHR